MKKIYLIVFLVTFTGFVAFAQFAPDDIAVGAPGIGYADPEFSSEYARMVFQTQENTVRKIYVGRIDPLNATLFSATGKDLLVDADVATLGSGQQTNNGPEWGLDFSGPSVFYEKPDSTGLVQVWRAEGVLAGPMQTLQLTHSAQGATNKLVREDASLPTTKFVYRRTNNDLGIGPLMWMDESDTTLSFQVPGFSTATFQVAWVPETEDFVYLRFTSPTNTEFAYYNTADQTSTFLTDDPGEKREPFAFRAPELGGELVLACVLDNTKLAFYRYDGATWYRWTTIAPPDSLHPYMRSPEIFQVGGITYFASKQADINAFNSNSAIWVSGLGTDTSSHFYRRIDEGLLSGVEINRNEPEIFIGSEEVFVFYNASGQLRRARTGIFLNTPPPDYPVTQVDWFKFSKDYTAGDYDTNNRYMGGTDLMYLTPHKSRLWAGTSVWNDNPGVDPEPGPQILVKNSASEYWQVDTSMGTGYLRTDALYSFVFTKDKFGNTLPQPDTLLMASFSDLTAPYDVCVWVRDDQNGAWHKTIVYPNVSSAENSYIRHMNLYEDKITGIQHVFAAGVTAVVRGAYNPSLPGKLEWQAIEITGPQRMLSSTVCNGDYYIAFASDGPANNKGGIFRRNDGPTPGWTPIFEWPDTGRIALGKNFRGMRAVPDPNGGNHQVLVGFIENLQSAWLIDPVHNIQNEEVNWFQYFRSEWGEDQTDFYYAAYNDMVDVIDPDNGDTCLLAGAWARYPAPYGTPERNNSWYFIRRPDGSWHYGQVIDSLNLIPPAAGLQATRSIVRSPFSDEPYAYYFGGRDAGGTQAIFHHTAWIYKGVLKKLPTSSPEPEVHADDVHVYPNPADGLVYIANLPADFQGTFTLINPQGQILLTERIFGSSRSVDISRLHSGMYFILIKSEKGDLFTRKFFKQSR